ncbi:SOS response-associated peptidase [Balneatrix alpica]|uniref:Abasic site processing protein n=1 Tax=Balneatrix alpica TaxID=75684 RepID=A0ABV5ZEJ0_9GAMM|nr:SOS response-associated peptidase family protein [Balneatrix alpica]
MAGRLSQGNLYQQTGLPAPQALGRPLEASYNLSPYQWLALQTATDTLVAAHWGLAPSWIKNLRQAPFTARKESLADNALFQQPLQQQRGLLPLQGYYDWLHAKGKRWPVFISSPEHPVLYAAALWQWYRLADVAYLTCALISVPANPFLGQFSQRMPALLDPTEHSRWLAADTPVEQCLALLQPYSATLQAWQVDPQVNSHHFQGSRCIVPQGRVFIG